jgi:hypothetical protein
MGNATKMEVTSSYSGLAKTMIRETEGEMNWGRFNHIFNTNFLYGAVFALVVLIIWNVVARFY